MFDSGSANDAVGERLVAHTQRPRAMTNHLADGSEPPLTARSAKGRHGRATSELPCSFSQRRDHLPNSVDSTSPANFDTETLTNCSDISALVRETKLDIKPSEAACPETSGTLKSTGSFDSTDVATQDPAEGDGSMRSTPKSPSNTATRGWNGTNGSFLNMEEVRHSHDAEEGHPKRISSDTDEGLDEARHDVTGLLFETLVNRLAAQNGKMDGKFIAIFLCFYRKFAAPSELIVALVARFETLNDSEPVQSTRVTGQLRCLNIVSQWMSEYPGDFAHPQARQITSSFVGGIMGNRYFTAAAKEVASQLETVVEDDDTEWACSDMSRPRSSTVESFLSISSAHSDGSTANAGSSTEDFCDESNFARPSSQHTPRHSATSSMSSNTGRSGSQSTGSFQTLLHSAEDAQRCARYLTPSPRFPLTKSHWHQFMDTSEEEVAKELTRIDWIMFSSIRPRDLVRHVSLQASEKRRCKQLENVNRMINHFNHIAFWVANLILLREKPKHRAKVLERFMNIAWVSHVETSCKSMRLIGIYRNFDISTITMHSVQWLRALTAPPSTAYHRLAI